MNNLNMSQGQALELAMSYHAGIWAERKLGFKNEPFHWEWYELEMQTNRLCVVAPREHAKSEIFSVISTAHHVVYRPGSWQFIFSATIEQSKLLLERAVSMIQQTDPMLIEDAKKWSTSDIIFGNYSRVSAASVGRSIRGVHPDRIVGDDVLTDASTSTNLQREKVERWWFGTVAPLAHPGVNRPLGWGNTKPQGHQPTLFHPATKIVLVGTPFHQNDLLMKMKQNTAYTFRRYSAEYDIKNLREGSWAIDGNN